MNDQGKAILRIITAYLFLYAFLFGIGRIEMWIRIKIFNSKLKKVNEAQIDKACETLGIKKGELKKMSKAKLKNIFRKLAMKHHPDHGGSENKFKEVREAYEFVYAQAA